jgi:hypothetical protein
MSPCRQFTFRTDVKKSCVFIFVKKCEKINKISKDLWSMKTVVIFWEGKGSIFVFDVFVPEVEAEKFVTKKSIFKKIMKNFQKFNILNKIFSSTVKAG